MITGNGRFAVLGLLAVGLGLGLTGIRWGLPSRERVDRILPKGVDGPAFHQKLMDSWSNLHKRLGSNIMLSPEAFGSFTGVQCAGPGWSVPPDLLLNSARSFYIRSAHEDEQTILIVLSRLKPWRLQMHPHFFTYGTTYIYSVGVWMALGAAAGAVTLKASLAPYLADPARMASLYLMGRLLSVTATLACAFMLWRIGRRHLTGRAGLLAAFLFLLCPAAVIQAHVLKNHAFWSFLALWTLDLSLGVLKEGGLRRYAAAGTTAGLTVGSYLSGWPACLLIAAASALRVRGGERWQAELRGLALAAACSVAAFFITNPYWLLDLREALAEMEILKGWSAFGLHHPLVYLWNPVRRSTTLPILALILGGLGLGLRRGREEAPLLLCAIAFLVGLSATILVAGVVSTRQVRYFLGWLGVGMLLAGRAADAALRPGPARAPAAAILLLAALNLGLEGATYAYNFHIASGPRSNHYLAGDWIEAHIPPGESIGMLRLPQPSNAPYFQYSRYELRFIERERFGALDPALLPRNLAVTIPDYDDRPGMEPNLSRYERAAAFGRPSLLPWAKVDETATTANPIIEIYRLRAPSAPGPRAAP